MKKQFAFTFLILLFSFLGYGQLSGSYTIGGVSPDYSTITAAVNALRTQGVSGSVVFNIRSGFYSEVIPDLLIFNPAINPVTFQSELLDSTSVIINNPTVTVNDNIFNVGGFINFREITFWDTSSYEALRGDFDLGVYNCIIRNESAIYMRSGIIQNCIIEGSITTFGYSGYSSYLINDSITGDINLSRGESFCFNNYIAGSVEVSYANGDFENNVLEPGWDSWVRFGYNKNIIRNNKFLGVRFMDLNFADSTQFIGNEVQIILQSDIFSSEHMQVIGNKFYSLFEITGCPNSFVTNNFFYSDIHFMNSSSSSFAYNNCSSDSGHTFFIEWSYNLIIENNNMPARIDNPYNLPVTLSNNNYFQLSTGVTDTHPFFINPQYISSTDLHSTNPQLIGKAISYPSVYNDIDSLQRSTTPTIGANEICLSSDTLNISCGDSVVLSLCNIPSSGNFIWSPSTGLNDVHIAKPTLSTSTSEMYLVRDTASGFSDSIYVNVIPFTVVAFSDDSLICGEHTVIFSTYNASALYQWTPLDSLISSSNYYTEAFPSLTTTYVVTATVPGCGTSSDSVTLFVNPFPTAYAYLDSTNHNYLSFLNASLCADTYTWDFGDSTAISTDENPSHVYSNTGQFIVTLIACNSFGCDTFQGYVYVDSVVFTAIPNYETLCKNFSIYPNPSTASFTISSTSKTPMEKIEVFNFLGEMILSDENKQRSISNREINLSAFPAGVYLLKISTSKGMEAKKIVVSR